MDALNIIFGIVSIASLLFSFWVFNSEKLKRGIEKEKAINLINKQYDISESINSVGTQLNLIIELSRRENTSIEEIRHLVVSAQYSLISISEILGEKNEIISNWKYGSPTEYIKKKTKVENDKNTAHNNV